MYPFDKNNWLRKLSEKTLFPFFWWTGMSANQVTRFNFFGVGLAVVASFALGYEFLGLLLAGLCAMIDYVDGTVARAGRGHPKGQYLDTSLDWLYLMLLIGAICFYHNIMVIGYLILIAITFGNWVQYNGGVNVKLPLWLGIDVFITIGVLTRKLDIAMLCVLLIQSIRTAVMYYRSMK
jgi:hypothetical protein